MIISLFLCFSSPCGVSQVSATDNTVRGPIIPPIQHRDEPDLGMNDQTDRTFVERIHSGIAVIRDDGVKTSPNLLNVFRALFSLSPCTRAISFPPSNVWSLGPYTVLNYCTWLVSLIHNLNSRLRFCEVEIEATRTARKAAAKPKCE